jgi:hypothetical protein
LCGGLFRALHRTYGLLPLCYIPDPFRRNQREWKSVSNATP